MVDKTPTSLTSLGETVFGGRLPSPARQLRVPRGAQSGQQARHHQLLLALPLLQDLGHMGEFFEEKFEFKDKEYLEFSKLTQVNS